MKRWLPWLAIPLILSVLTVLSHARGNGLLDDSDTKVLLQNIQARGDAMSWFRGDWPLFNHFYRPISTLFFEGDLAIYGMNGSGFGMTNALIAGLCIWLAFWVGRELTDSPATAGMGTLLFGLAHLQLGLATQLFSLFWIVGLASLCGFARGKFKERVFPVGLAFFGCIFLASLLPGPLDFRARVVDWLPGRTASVMSIFALISVAAYARFERLTAVKREAVPTSTDLPATKGTKVERPGRLSWGWVVVSVIGLVLALGSYEQAVVIPGLITGVLILFSLQGRKVHWANAAIFWAVLIGYVILRRALVPSDVSGYQAQQFRSGPGVYIDLANYLAPGFAGMPNLASYLDLGALALLSGFAWTLCAVLVGNAVSLVGVWRDPNRWLAIGLIVMGFVAFMPMAWLKFFAHYHYFPAVFYSLFAVVLLQMVLKWVVEALSPGPVLAPARGGG